MPQKIILIRHGETNHNINDLVQGWLDIDLNKRGMSQAKKAANKLKNEIIHAIYSSDLKRTLKTAKTIAQKRKLEVFSNKKLREWNMGNWAGKKWPEIYKNYSHIFNDQKIVIDQDWKEHGGESISEMKTRLKDFLQYLKAKHQGHTVVIVTHGGAKRLILQHLNIVPWHQKPSFSNSAITIIEKNKKGNYEPKLLNDTSHLDD